MNKRQMTGEGAGLVHLPGMDAHDHETFCGFCWSGNSYEDTTETVTCPGCHRAVKQALEIIDSLPGSALRIRRPRGIKYDHEEILRLVEAGLSDRAIAEHVGAHWDVTTGTAPSIRSIRRMHGLVKPTRSERPAWEAELKAMHEEGLTIIQMVEKSQWSTAKVRRRLHLLQLPAHRAPNPRRTTE